jgi:hypothetical protein
MTVQPRIPSGQGKVSGQFATKTNSDADFAASIGQEPDDPDVIAAATASSEELTRYVDHYSWFVRAEVASSSAATDEHLQVLSRDENWMVRWTVAQRSDSAVPLSMSEDPDPRVAAMVANHYMASPEIRSRVLSRPDVMRMLVRIQGDPLHRLPT